MWEKLAVVAFLALTIPQQPVDDTVAVILSPDQPAIILPRSEAEAQFKQLCADGSDDKRLRALAAALNPMPDWPQFVLNNEPSVCNRNPKPLPTPVKDGE